MGRVRMPPSVILPECHPEHQSVILSAAKDLARWAAMLRGVYTECNERAQHDRSGLPTVLWYGESVPPMVSQ